MRKQTTSPNTIAIRDKHRRAVELRVAGWSLQQIADELGYSDPSGAYNAIKAELRDTAMPAVCELRNLEAARLDEMQRSIWDAALSGNVSAFEAALKLMQRRAQMLGLDAPTKIAPTDPTGEVSYAVTISWPDLPDLPGEVIEGELADDGPLALASGSGSDEDPEPEAEAEAEAES